MLIKSKNQTKNPIERTLTQYGEYLYPRIQAMLTVKKSSVQYQQMLRHAALYSGKAIRPFLLQHIAKFYHVPFSRSVQVAMAIELIHLYSLIHDDHPSMDNSPRRRHNPTVHGIYGEGSAILAGDAYLTLAFHVLSGMPASSYVRVKLIEILSNAAGLNELIQGQFMDLYENVSKNQITLYEKKTGALFAAACMMAVTLSTQYVSIPENIQKKWYEFGLKLGILFQVQDDFLDTFGNIGDMGKPVHQAFISHTAIKNQQEYIDFCIHFIDCYARKDEKLRQLIYYISRRKW